MTNRGFEKIGIPSFREKLLRIAFLRERHLRDVRKYTRRSFHGFQTWLAQQPELSVDPSTLNKIINGRSGYEPDALFLQKLNEIFGIECDEFSSIMMWRSTVEEIEIEAKNLIPSPTAIASTATDRRPAVGQWQRLIDLVPVTTNLKILHTHKRSFTRHPPSAPPNMQSISTNEDVFLSFIVPHGMLPSTHIILGGDSQRWSSIHPDPRYVPKESLSNELTVRDEKNIFPPIPDGSAVREGLGLRFDGSNLGYHVFLILFARGDFERSLFRDGLIEALLLVDTMLPALDQIGQRILNLGDHGAAQWQIMKAAAWVVQSKSRASPNNDSA